MFVNRAPILWYSKRQATVEGSTFSAEFLALKTVTKSIQNLRFKSRSFGVPILNNEASHIFCDNKSVVVNSSQVESKLNKKHNAVAYHFVRYSVAAKMITVAWIKTRENLADVFTKRLSRQKREYLFGKFTY